MRIQISKSILTLLFLAAITPVSAADEPAKVKKDLVEQQVQRRFELPDAISLTDEQKTKLESIKKEYSTKVRDLIEKREGNLTAEQKQARRAAQKEAKQAGKKQKEINEAGVAALKLSGEQLKQFTDVEDEIKKLDKEIRSKVAEILTDEQKANLKKSKKSAD